MINKWKKYLTNTDTIPSNKPFFSLNFLFIMALCSLGIFYRFVYIHTHNSQLALILHDYNLSHSARIYIEGVCFIIWIIFLTNILLRISIFIYDNILFPLLKILNSIIILLFNGFDFIAKKIYYLFNKKYIDNKVSYDKIKGKKQKIRIK